MDIPHDTVFVSVATYTATGYFTGMLAGQGFTVVASGLQLAMSQEAYNWLEERIKNGNYTAGF